MTLSILKLAPGQKIARPFNRACDEAEATEMLRHWESRNPGSTVQLLRLRHKDTEKPVFQHAGHKFFIFTEE